MPAERYFIDQPLNLQSQIILKDTEFHHLIHVMRTRKGEQVELINGQGLLALATVKDILKDQARLFINEVHTEMQRKERVILAQAIPKPNRLDFIIEKGTELGVDEFWLFPGKLSLKKDFSENQLERLESQTIVAMKQCGRLFLPKLCVKPALKEWKEWPKHAFFGDIESQAPLFLNIWKEKNWEEKDKIESIIFFVGPESGFNEEEISCLRQNGVTGVRLHQNILRTDTASLVALSLITHWLLK